MPKRVWKVFARIAENVHAQWMLGERDDPKCNHIIIIIITQNGRRSSCASPPIHKSGLDFFSRNSIKMVVYWYYLIIIFVIIYLWRIPFENMTNKIICRPIQFHVASLLSPKLKRSNVVAKNKRNVSFVEIKKWNGPQITYLVDKI